MVITNLFYRFDLYIDSGLYCTFLGFFLGFFWLILFKPFYWVISRGGQLFSGLVFSRGFNNLTELNLKSWLWFFILFCIIFFINLFGLHTYTPIITVYFSTCFRLACLYWVGWFYELWLFNFKGGFYSVTPANIRVFMCLILSIIELLRRLIRPITLRVRVLANILAGHVLVSIICGFRLLLRFNRFMIFLSLGFFFRFFEVAVVIVQRSLYTGLLINFYMDYKGL